MVLVLLMAVGQEAACLDGRNKLSHFARSQYIGIIFIRTKKLCESALMGDTDLLKEIK